MLIKSPAKINLTLEVQAKLPSGYHRLSTLMAKIPLEDELDFRLWDEPEIILEGDRNSTRKKADNLIYRAGRLLQQVSGWETGFVCHIKKIIPVKAGLGGGSSNAAVTLLALNQLWRLDLGEKELLKLAQKLGADVPFFINPAQVIFETNHGDLAAEPQQYVLPDLPKSWLLVVKPRFSVSTERAFELWDEKQATRPAVLTADRTDELTDELLVGQGLKDQNLNLITQGTSNDFQADLFAGRAVYKKAAALLEKNGALNVTLTGSGAAFYAFFGQKKQAELAKKKLAECCKTLQIFLLEIGEKSKTGAKND